MNASRASSAWTWIETGFVWVSCEVESASQLSFCIDGPSSSNLCVVLMCGYLKNVPETDYPVHLLVILTTFIVYWYILDRPKYNRFNCYFRFKLKQLRAVFVLATVLLNALSINSGS